MRGVMGREFTPHSPEPGPRQVILQPSQPSTSGAALEQLWSRAALLGARCRGWGSAEGMLRHRTVLPAQLELLAEFREPLGEEGLSSSHRWGTWKKIWQQHPSHPQGFVSSLVSCSPARMVQAVWPWPSVPPPATEVSGR